MSVARLYLKWHRCCVNAAFQKPVKRCYSEFVTNRNFFIPETKYSSVLEPIDPDDVDSIPIYRVLNENGSVFSLKDVPKIDDEKLLYMLKTMIKLNQIDKILYDSQRQGRISFYMTNNGEEASHIDDLIYGQYREAGVLLFRGFTLESLMNQCYSNSKDAGKGRQMPVHYGSKDLNFATISSPLATQMPIGKSNESCFIYVAVGSAYAMKRLNKENVVCCYFGEGAASEGDAHAAMNFASTLDCPIIFFCRNNGYAISTCADEQYKGDGIAGRGVALGIHTIRVDGNDVFAVYNATTKAREISLKLKRPVLIEAMTYRIGHHSTSDDSTAYRTAEEVEFWNDTKNPISRFRTYLMNKKIWSEDAEKDFLKKTKKEILSEFSKAEKTKKPNPLEMFADVYRTMPPRLEKQMRETMKHLETHKDKYPLDLHEPLEVPK